MKLPKINEPKRYVGLYVVDFGEHTGVGFTAQETAEILESEKYKDCKVYKIHNAYPDGSLELKGVRSEIFQLEAGMLFYEDNHIAVKGDFKTLVGLAVKTAPPCRTKVQLAKYSDDKFATVLIYPAEYDDEMSKWLTDNDYKTKGAAEGGIGAVERYYQAKPEILEIHQLTGREAIESRSGSELLANLKAAVQR
jgi:hypothetical protein